MKVKDLLHNIEQFRKSHPDIDEWEVYTEQPDLIVPEDYMSYDECFDKYKDNDEYLQALSKSRDRIKELEKDGWKFKYDSEGWVYRDIADDGNHTLFVKDKILTINNNY